jgi:hypothetical protein
MSLFAGKVLADFLLGNPNPGSFYLFHDGGHNLSGVPWEGFMTGL